MPVAQAVLQALVDPHARVRIHRVVRPGGHPIDRPGSTDAASWLYFVGRSSEKPLRDSQLVSQCRGAVPL